MKLPASLGLVFVLFLKVFALSAQSEQDSLINELSNIKTDTGRISMLIGLAYLAESTEDALSFTKQAYDLGKQVESIKHKSRSEIVHGSYLAEQDLDAGMHLINTALKRYESEKMWLYVANAYFVKAQTYEFLNEIDSALDSYQKSFYIASRNEFHPEWGDAALAMSYIYHLTGENAIALRWATEAKKAYELTSDKDLQVADVLNQMGMIYDQTRFYSEALDCYLQAKESAAIANYIQGEILINNNIGVIYDNMNNSETAMQYFSEALEKAKIHNLRSDEATLMNNMSYIYQKRGDTAMAIQLLRDVLKIEVTIENACFLSYPLEAMGSLLLEKNKLDSAEFYLNEALEISQECEEVSIESSIYKSLGQLYLRQNKKSQSVNALRRSLEIARKANLPTESQEALYEIATYYEKTNQKEEALNALKKYQLFSDSLFKASSVEKAARLASEYEFRKEIADLELQRLETERKFSEQIETKTLENRIILIGTVLLLILAVIFIRGYALIKGKNKKLALLNEDKNKLIGVVAHDLRNPINMMKGLLHFLGDAQKATDIPAEYPQYLDMLNQSADKMSNMIDRVLDISAIENMKLNLKTERVDLNELVSKSVRNFELIARQKSIEIVGNVAENAVFTSKADPNYLEQVIDNLISNAIKFSEKGKWIYISLDGDSEKNTIEVRDEGPGISKEDQRRIFHAYTTTSTKSTNQEKSTGLGLSIAQRFIHAMGGSIAIESEVGTGTSFIISLKKS